MAWSGPGQSGGFDFDFVATPPDRLCCAICLHVLRDPHQTDCGHQFCLSCITKAYHQSLVCPVCKKTYSIFRDQIVAREVRGLQVRCSKESLGCEWVGELGSYIDTHIHQCGFINVSCMHCKQLVPKRLITKHQDLLCPLRKYDCDYCRTYVSTYDDVTKNHWPICKFFPVPCPNDCPTGSVPRNHLMEHIKNDCKVKKEAAEMKSQHTKLLEKVHYLQEEFEKKNDENHENERKLKEQARQVEQFEQEVAEKDKRIKELEKQVKDLLSKIEELQQPLGDEEDGPSDHHEQATVSQQRQWGGSPQLTVSRGRSATQVEEPNLQANLLQDPNIYLEWSLCQPLPENMVDGHAVVIGEFVYAGGGTNGDVVYKYHIKNNTWATLPKANRQKFAMVCYNSQLILIGGKGLIYCNSLLVWDEQTHMWTDGLCPPMDTARMQPAALSHKEHIIVAGGKNALLTSLDSVEMFDGNKWYYVAPLPAKIHSAKAALFENQLYLMGGNGQKKAVYCTPLDSLNKNCLSDVWGSIAESDFPNAAIVTFGNTLIALGGSTAMGSTNVVRGYFTGTKTWLQLYKPLPRSLYAVTAVVTSPEELLVIGGRSGAVSYKSVYKAILKYS